MISRTTDRAAWSTAWPDALAFAGGLVVAGLLDWRTTDLVWSLWLSSLVVGYATMAWPVLRLARTVTAALSRGASHRYPVAASAGIGVTVLVVVIGGSVGLAVAVFMTLHFAGFHFVHALLLAEVFPLQGVPGMWGDRDLVTAFGEIFQR